MKECKNVKYRGGRTVFLQLVHLHNARSGWLEIADQTRFIKKLDTETGYDQKILKRAL